MRRIQSIFVFGFHQIDQKYLICDEYTRNHSLASPVENDYIYYMCIEYMCNRFRWPMTLRSSLNPASQSLPLPFAQIFVCYIWMTLISFFADRSALGSLSQSSSYIYHIILNVYIEIQLMVTNIYMSISVSNLNQSYVRYHVYQSGTSERCRRIGWTELYRWEGGRI